MRNSVMCGRKKRERGRGLFSPCFDVSDFALAAGYISVIIFICFSTSVGAREKEAVSPGLSYEESVAASAIQGTGGTHTGNAGNAGNTAEIAGAGEMPSGGEGEKEKGEGEKDDGTARPAARSIWEKLYIWLDKFFKSKGIGGL